MRLTTKPTGQNFSILATIEETSLTTEHKQGYRLKTWKKLNPVFSKSTLALLKKENHTNKKWIAIGFLLADDITLHISSIRRKNSAFNPYYHPNLYKPL